ncbi:uncharacterized protein LOC120326192 [Styela clava]|uniref:uncharacterized protein LOC120326191 n=1 Tax=Styela clava TaxID=7725 RepID=UPI00193ACB3E|nr:uncharacterized protein LOC120326191 [Styela clava]
MGKYSKYSSNYPTQYNNWMYPPKNIGLLKYFTMNCQGIWRTNASAIKGSWSYVIATTVVVYGMYKITKAGKGTKFHQSVKDQKGNWLYGPPSQKFIDEIHEHHIMHAPHK